jgi:hypothetical protein
MLTLVNLLGIKESDYQDYKLYLGTEQNDLQAKLRKYLEGTFDQDVCQCTKRNYNRKFLIALVYYDKDKWLYVGTYRVVSGPIYVEDPIWNHHEYVLEKISLGSDLVGRAIFYYKRNFEASYLNFEMKPNNNERPSEMQLLQLLESPLTIKDFPGYDNVNIQYSTLEKMIIDNLQSWKSALTKAKGIYLIVDTKSGKQYVGKADGNEGIWQRWSAYAKTGHGGNSDLKKLLEENGSDYKYNFKYSILEICNLNTSDLYIDEREKYWKNVLFSRNFGLNRN